MKSHWPKQGELNMKKDQKNKSNSGKEVAYDEEFSMLRNITPSPEETSNWEQALRAVTESHLQKKRRLETNFLAQMG